MDLGLINELLEVDNRLERASTLSEQEKLAMYTEVQSILDLFFTIKDDEVMKKAIRERQAKLAILEEKARQKKQAQAKKLADENQARINKSVGEWFGCFATEGVEDCENDKWRALAAHIMRRAGGK